MCVIKSLVLLQALSGNKFVKNVNKACTNENHQCCAANTDDGQASMSGTYSASSCKISLNLSDKAKQDQPEVTGYCFIDKFPEEQQPEQSQSMNARSFWSVENIINAERLKGTDFRTSPDSYAVTELMQEEENIQGNDVELGDNSEPTSVEFDKELFIEEVRKYWCLWDINLEAYKNRTIKKNAWAMIETIFNKDGEFYIVYNKDLYSYKYRLKIISLGLFLCFVPKILFLCFVPPYVFIMLSV